MPSAGKTPKLNLDQWLGSDIPATREDLNQDFMKIDDYATDAANQLTTANGNIAQLQLTLGNIQDIAEGAEEDASNAITVATAAQNRADEAYGEAETARNEAADAQATGDSAAVSASTALTAANTAQSRADNAYSLANSAQQLANDAMEEAQKVDDMFNFTVEKLPVTFIKASGNTGNWSLNSNYTQISVLDTVGSKSFKVYGTFIVEATANGGSSGTARIHVNNALSVPPTQQYTVSPVGTVYSMASAIELQNIGVVSLIVNTDGSLDLEFSQAAGTTIRRIMVIITPSLLINKDYGDTEPPIDSASYNISPMQQKVTVEQVEEIVVNVIDQMGLTPNQ